MLRKTFLILDEDGYWVDASVELVITNWKKEMEKNG